MDLRSAISAHGGEGGAVAGDLVPGRQRQHRHRQGELLPARRWPADAGQEESGPAGSTLFHAGSEVTVARRVFLVDTSRHHTRPATALSLGTRAHQRENPATAPLTIPLALSSFASKHR